MAFSGIENLQLGKFLQIAFSEGIRFQLSGDVRDWDMIRKVREGDPNGREVRFLFQTSLGPAAIQSMNPGVAGAFPESQDIGISENTAQYKEMAATIEFDYNLWQAAQKSPAKYADFLAKEIESKTIAYKRQISKELYGDGTGVIGQLAASSAVLASGAVTFQLDVASAARGHVGNFEINDILVIKSVTGGASAMVTTPAIPATSYWRVQRRDRKADKVTLQLLDASKQPITVSAIGTQPSAGDVFYRLQASIPNLTSNTTVGDYGVTSEVMAGLESLTADDGRSVHGIVMSGSSAGSRLDAGASAIDVSFLQELLDTTKVNVGQTTYKYKTLVASPEAHASLIESRETDRRFISVEDKTRGIKGMFVFAHMNDLLEFYTSEYCPKKRLYVLPESSAGEKVLEYHSTDFEQVKVNDSSAFNLKPSANGYLRRVSTFMHGRHVLINKHPASIGVLTNFTV